MKWQLYVFIAFAVSGAIGGLATTIMYQTMVDGLNRRRSTDDQIPATFGTVKDVRWYLANAPSPYWKVLREFHSQFPQSRMYFWNIVIFIVMGALFLAVVATMIVSHAAK